MDNIQRRFHQLLSQLELELKRHDLWASAPPTQAQMTSQVPFAADVMPFEMWLQFIFMAKMNTMITQQHPLPKNMNISPMAELSFTGTQTSITQILQQIDALSAE